MTAAIRISEEMRVMLKRIRALQPEYDRLLNIEHEPRSDRYLIEVGWRSPSMKLEENLALLTPPKVTP